MNNLLKNWHTMRILHLVIGIGLLVYFFVSSNSFILLFSILFLAMGIFNFSCCGGSCGCQSPTEKDDSKQLFKNDIKKMKK